MRIAVAGGFDKVPAILAALRGGYVNVLITDAATGRGILNADGVTEIAQKSLQRPRVESEISALNSARTQIKKFLNNPDDVVEEIRRRDEDGARRAMENVIRVGRARIADALGTPSSGPA